MPRRFTTHRMYDATRVACHVMLASLEEKEAMEGQCRLWRQLTVFCNLIPLIVTQETGLLSMEQKSTVRFKTKVILKCPLSLSLSLSLSNPPQLLDKACSEKVRALTPGNEQFSGV